MGGGRRHFQILMAIRMARRFHAFWAPAKVNLGLKEYQPLLTSKIVIGNTHPRGMKEGARIALMGSFQRRGFWKNRKMLLGRIRTARSSTLVDGTNCEDRNGRQKLRSVWNRSSLELA
jgi:hypothetical protein